MLRAYTCFIPWVAGHLETSAFGFYEQQAGEPGPSESLVRVGGTSML